MNICEFPGFDKETFFNRMMNDMELITEVLELFLADTPKKIEKLKQAAKDNDVEEIRSNAHSIKGSSANVCMDDLQKIAYEIEIAGKDKNLKEIGELITKLKDCFDTIEKNLS